MLKAVTGFDLVVTELTFFLVGWGVSGTVCRILTGNPKLTGSLPVDNIDLNKDALFTL